MALQPSCRRRCPAPLLLPLRLLASGATCSAPRSPLNPALKAVQPVKGCEDALQVRCSGPGNETQVVATAAGSACIRSHSHNAETRKSLE